MFTHLQLMILAPGYKVTLELTLLGQRAGRATCEKRTITPCSEGVNVHKSLSTISVAKCGHVVEAIEVAS